MFKVDRPTLAPAECLYTHRADEAHGPYVDFNCDFTVIHQGRMYLARTAVEEAAKTLGMPTVQMYEQAASEALELAQENAALRARVEDLEKFEENATWTLEHFGQPVRKKPGRPKQKKKELIDA